MLIITNHKNQRSILYLSTQHTVLSTQKCFTQKNTVPGYIYKQKSTPRKIR